MIIASMSQPAQVAACHPLMPRLIEFLSTLDLSDLPEGRIVVDGDRIFINNSNVEGRKASEMPLEFHRDYIDVHILLEGEETIGWTPIHDVITWSKPYEKDDDCALSTDAHSLYFTLKPGQMAVMFPEDGHAPIISDGHIHKLICKVLI